MFLHPFSGLKFRRQEHYIFCITSLLAHHGGIYKPSIAKMTTFALAAAFLGHLSLASAGQLEPVSLFFVF